MEIYQAKYVVLAAEYYQVQEIMEHLNEMEMGNPIDFAAKHDPDTMYFHQAIKHLNAPQFIE
eukprot:13821235-Ditylum_brightwellii.AAC.1